MFSYRAYDSGIHFSASNIWAELHNPNLHSRGNFKNHVAL